CQQNDNSPYSF
nr:immunoglobulin light chain junction region [Macaca mulatta]MOW34319.1 immunoglobulin light chain junction region [Macaca mulatta]MOW34422.1 immunoglobulin light chain junction region [Macaca mulatta]MOW34568.1 immunoglobulin light chain junction region [Macaca mulatta]MOW35959.1 immunoglobulin light chain junction region [Macaca mulatta]